MLDTSSLQRASPIHTHGVIVITNPSHSFHSVFYYFFTILSLVSEFLCNPWYPRRPNLNTAPSAMSLTHDALGPPLGLPLSLVGPHR
jgi:hypothetical protein